MTPGLRYAALRLGALAAVDASWILGRLPSAEANALRTLMNDPAVARLASAAGQVEAPRNMEEAHVEAPVAPMADWTFLDGEMAPWAAVCLHAMGNGATERYLEATAPARARRVSDALTGTPRSLPPRLRETLLAWSGGQGDHS